MGEQMVVLRSQREITCDATGCPRVEKSDPVNDAVYGFTALGREFERSLKRQGWSRWVSRGVRWYCPNHGPSKSSRARRDDS